MPTERPPADGGHVYPATGDAGLSVRDYFAGQALAGLLSDPAGSTAVRLNAAAIAAIAYQAADAMLAARKPAKPALELSELARNALTLLSPDEWVSTHNLADGLGHDIASRRLWAAIQELSLADRIETSKGGYRLPPVIDPRD